MENLPDNSPILIVDDDKGLLLSIRAALLSAGLPDPALLSDSRRVVPVLKKNCFQLAILDLIMPYMDGMEVLKHVKQESPSTECIIVTAVDDVAIAVQAMRYGAYDYLVKPLNIERTTIAVRHALERYQLKQGMALFERPQSFSDLKRADVFSEMIARDESMALVFRQAETCAETDYNVIISGETGVGKGLLARIIHRMSRRSSGPFVAVNMPAFNQNLFEDEFFGHVRGAYTGAIADKRGFFEAAQGGTLFLDEITELDPNTQGKLLRVIEEKEFYRLGSTQIMNVDLRILSASNRDVNQAVTSGHFRGDLYYRLNEYHIHIPPLRHRKKDIAALAELFMRQHAKKNNKNIKGITRELSNVLQQYEFPGNVRELENIIASAVLVEKTEVLTLSSARSLMPEHSCTEPEQSLPALATMERRHIEQALNLTGGNRTQAARLLGIGLRTLQRKIKLYACIDTSK